MMHPLSRAFALSLAAHLAIFTGVEAGKRLHLWDFSSVALLAKALNPEFLPSQNQASEAERRAREQALQEDIQLVFVDVDPSQATADAPANTPFYSTVNSRAANPSIKRETAQPQMDGKQDKVAKTKDTVKPGPSGRLSRPAAQALVVDTPNERPPDPKPMPPAPLQPAQPLRPATPAPPRPTVAEQPQPKPLGETEYASATQAPRAPQVGTPAMATPTAGLLAPAPQARARPRTVAEARAQAAAQGNSSALTGERMRQEGGVKRFAVESSLDTKATAFGAYDAKFVQAVQQCWFALLQQQRYSLDRVGKVILEFRLTYDGRITDMKVVESDVGDIYTLICQLSITKPAPYERWPAEMRRVNNGDYRSVRFTFYY
jgi:hypothetical protein